MTRTELEIKLHRDRVWALEVWGAYSDDELTRGITTSRHDAANRWSALDHLAHLAGIEATFNRIIRTHLSGAGDPFAPLKAADGTSLPLEQVMARVHALNEKWILGQRGKGFDEIVALGQQVRADTLALLAGLTEMQLNEKVAGAPWGDGTIGGILAINGYHTRQHHGWVTKGLAQQP
jgi:hypothetical protein